MMEENNDIFLAGGDALVYLAVALHKKYSTKCVWGIHLVRTYLSTDFSTPVFLVCIESYCFCRNPTAKNYFKHNRIYALNNMT